MGNRSTSCIKIKMESLVTGVDIGGTHITVSIIDIDTGRVINESNSRGHIDTSLDADAVIKSWAEIIKQAHNKTEIAIGKVGIAMPGPFDYENGISYIKGLHKYESLYGLNVKQMLARELGIEAGKIKMINDASAYLLGERGAGAGREHDNIVGITLGTGLGSAAYYNENLEEGDLYCTDFESGKCEDYASARWIIGEYQKLSGARLPAVKEIAERCDNDRHAKFVFEKFGHTLYRILYKRYLKQSPNLVIIGGNIAKAWDLFIPSLQNAMNETGFRFQVKQAELGEEAALIGAAYLWNEKK
jgi:glucokinase